MAKISLKIAQSIIDSETNIDPDQEKHIREQIANSSNGSLHTVCLSNFGVQFILELFELIDKKEFSKSQLFKNYSKHYNSADFTESYYDKKDLTRDLFSEVIGLYNNYYGEFPKRLSKKEREILKKLSDRKKGKIFKVVQTLSIKDSVIKVIFKRFEDEVEWFIHTLKSFKNYGESKENKEVFDERERTNKISFKQLDNNYQLLKEKIDSLQEAKDDLFDVYQDDLLKVARDYQHTFEHGILKDFTTSVFNKAIEEFDFNLNNFYLFFEWYLRLNIVELFFKETYNDKFPEEWEDKIIDFIHHHLLAIVIYDRIPSVDEYAKEHNMTIDEVALLSDMVKHPKNYQFNYPDQKTITIIGYSSKKARKKVSKKDLSKRIKNPIKQLSNEALIAKVQSTTLKNFSINRPSKTTPKFVVSLKNSYLIDDSIKKKSKRDPYISELAKRLAKGRCQLCKNKAPFVDLDGKPYLESHHIEWLERQGTDTLENIVAVCPNCHKKLHILDLESDVNYLMDIAKKISSDFD